MNQEKTTASHYFHNAKNDMRKWLVDNGNKFIANIEPRLAASFNRFVKKEFPEIYEKAQEAVKSANRWCQRYSREDVYCYVSYDKNFKIGAVDPYPKSPTKAQLLSDTIWLLAVRVYAN